MAKILTVQELEAKIKTLEGIGEMQAAEKYKAELKILKEKEAKLPEPEVETKQPMEATEVAQETPVAEVADETPDDGEGWLTIPVSKNEWEAAGGRASAGLHIAEMQMPHDDTPGVSIAFPFELVGEYDPDKGKKGKVSAGVSPAAVWKLKDILKALNIPLKFVADKNGVEYPRFDAKLVAGKQAKILYESETGHKGGDKNAPIVKYTKATSVFPLDAEAENLGI